jgi:hypothetical protein
MFIAKQHCTNIKELAKLKGVLLKSFFFNTTFVKGLSYNCSFKSFCKVSVNNCCFRTVIKDIFSKFYCYKIKRLC